ncbi:MAG: pyridoxal phosphate-dependent aminotransferase [Polyangiaceae bacterium]|nr:pyridoxal phosphate-dependent aminotransferase [Polyangiaceae bacterium]
MFSQRLPENLSPNPLTEALAALRGKALNVRDLTLSNPTQAGFAYPGELLAPLSAPAALAYDPNSTLVERSPIVDLWKRRGYCVAPSQVVLTASTSEAYAALFKLLCDPDDEVLVPRPSYPLLDHLARFESVILRDYRLSYDGSWAIDWDSLERARTEKTRAICVISPNNPTGSYLKADELERLEALGLPVISDEVFGDYPLTSDNRRITSVVGAKTGLFFSLDGLSKSVGLPQMKLSWITVAGEPALVRAATERLEFVLDAYLSVSTPIKTAASHFLSVGKVVTRSIHERVLGNYRVLGECLRNTPVSLLFAEGGWCAVLQLPTLMTDEAWALKLLNEKHVLTQPGYFYDFEEEARLVVSLLTPPEILSQGIEALLELVAGCCSSPTQPKNAAGST